LKTKSWLRLYHEFADDPKIQMLAFEDQRHYVMVLCLKGRGVLDSGTPNADYRERMIAKALGLDPLTSREVKFRLMEPGLIDENWQPVRWAERQFESDNSTERVQKYRDKRKRFGNVSSKQEPEPEGQLVNRDGNVSVTAQIRSEQSKNPPPGDSYEAKSADGRASPSGSPAARKAEPEPAPEPKRKSKADLPAAPLQFDETRSRQRWWNHAVNWVLPAASVLEIAGVPPKTSRLEEISNVYTRRTLSDVCADLTTWAVSEHRRVWPKDSDAELRDITAEIESRLRRTLSDIKPRPASASSSDEAALARIEAAA
jgi:hypothetical protein